MYNKMGNIGKKIMLSVFVMCGIACSTVQAASAVTVARCTQVLAVGYSLFRGGLAASSLTRIPTNYEPTHLRAQKTAEYNMDVLAWPLAKAWGALLVAGGIEVAMQLRQRASTEQKNNRVLPDSSEIRTAVNTARGETISRCQSFPSGIIVYSTSMNAIGASCHTAATCFPSSRNVQVRYEVVKDTSASTPGNNRSKDIITGDAAQKIYRELESSYNNPNSPN